MKVWKRWELIHTELPNSIAVVKSEKVNGPEWTCFRMNQPEQYLEDLIDMGWDWHDWALKRKAPPDRVVRWMELHQANVAVHNDLPWGRWYRKVLVVAREKNKAVMMVVPTFWKGELTSRGKRTHKGYRGYRKAVYRSMTCKEAERYLAFGW